MNDGTEPYLLRSFHPRLFCVTASRFVLGREIFLMGFLFRLVACLFLGGGV